MSPDAKKALPQGTRRGRRSKHRTLRASAFLGQTVANSPPREAPERGSDRGATEGEIVSRQLFVSMMCETFLGPLMSCGVCHRRPLDVGAGFVSLEPEHDTAKGLVVGRVVCGACAAEHGPDERRLTKLFEERSVGLPRSYGGSRDIAFVGQPFDVNVEVVEGRQR